jgi:tetratricopeptide (TPR) repeat protein
MSQHTHTRIVLLIAALAAACSNPEMQKRRHLERGNSYAAQKRDEFAVIEYASAVRLDPKFGDARLKLAETYERMGNLRAAFPEFIRAADALPDNRDLQLKVTEILLVAGRFDDAKARVGTLLNRDPKDVDALILHASAIAALKDPQGAIDEIEEALKIQPQDSRALINLGTVRMRTGDAREAEAAFRSAISFDRSSVNAHLAYANFLWSSGRQPEAEQELKQALALKPKDVLANRMLASLYLSTNRAADAEQPLKVVAESSTLPAARFQLAQYYVTVKRVQDATKLLTALSDDPGTFADAEGMLASIEYDAGHHDEAHSRLDKLIARTPKDSRPLVMKARWLATEKKLDDALTKAEAAIAADSQSAPAYYMLGMVRDLRHEAPDAIKAYTEALRLNPRILAAQVELSRLSLATGNRDAALRYAEQAKQTEPTNAAAHIALARSLLAKNDVGRAESEINALLRSLPNVADVHVLNGSLQMQRKNNVAARASFVRALELMPGSLDAIAGLTQLDLQEKKIDSALSRIDAQVAKEPDRAELLALAAQVFMQVQQDDRAERVLRHAVVVDPRFSTAYALLAQLYVKEKKLDAARAEFEGMVKRNPGEVGARTMVGLILETQGKREEAKRWYEATVAEVSNAPIVANNLAFIYAEEGTNLDVALQLASSAKQQMPDSPVVDDTLGWVYYKKDLVALAVHPLEESLKRRPDNPSVLYHLGLTYAKSGDKSKARGALEQAMKLNPRLNDVAGVRQTLASVSQ